MAKKLSKIATSLKQIGDIQVSEFDFKGLMQTDIKDLEVSRSLRRLGSYKVTEWEFSDILPAVNRLAQKEVDVVDLVKRAANYKVMEWDFRDALGSAEDDEVFEVRKVPSPEEMQKLVLRLKDFLQFTVVNLIDQPQHAQIKVREIEPGVLRFKVVLVKRDASMLIGMQGHTASAIRNLLKAAAVAHGVLALLQIHSHEEEAALAAQEADNSRRR
jgi:predicted RNA-binding protein YlqC (UPF0109 family)